MKAVIIAFLNFLLTFLTDGKLGLNVDYSVFRHSESQSYLEIFYSLQKSKLSYNYKDGKYNISVFLRLDVINLDKDSALIRKGWKIETGFQDTSGIAGEDIVDILRFYTPEGRYRVIMRAIDLYNTQNYDSVSFDVNVPVFGIKDKLMISSLELCYSINKSTDTADVFYKNSYKVVPNPTALYGLNVPVLYYYFELYNVLSGVKGDGYQINVNVLDNNQNKVPEVKEKKFIRNKLYNSVVEVGTVNVNMLPTGIYYLDVVVSELDGSLLAESRRKFFIYNPSVPPKVDTSLIMSELIGIDEKDLDEEFSKAVYISTQEEKNMYSKLMGVEAKRRFIGLFWARRGGIEFRKKYLDRVEQANEKFTTRFLPGWRTDRGRVYIIYGPPDEVERYPYSENMKPYEIWHYYNLQGGVIFVFGDRTGFGSYELLHSTLVGEIKNEQWMYLLMQR
ncbi:GWxTD domain-containing protein [Candidatus Kryptobacter tengchongensis]|uniref:GWxTD domain-containing protein n=1 Tax=Kryptobacter tengchongensis TaxID=1643429 RepID=UPI0007080A05|nr:GWxTD domain-containing protein [Candidatus Kryptobacter tengchongensis]CUS79306.1 GWxTD domain-containing protein [Candidatus Kryptobacter tengchongensis]CUU10951.1 GWxTD domain-containing protein [Candidatus Kryptobacter tengchongensis]